MKYLANLSFVAVLILTLAGCATSSKVASMEGRGTKQVFSASFDEVWRAAVDAAQSGELQVLNSDRERGYIAAKRSIQLESFGENVGIWVRELSANETQVEVVSRQSGPPVMWMKNWQNEILRAIAANLTR